MKLKKVATDNSGKTTTTLYLGNAVYGAINAVKTKKVGSVKGEVCGVACGLLKV